MNTNDLHDEAVTNVFDELTANPNFHPEISVNRKDGFDIKVSIQGQKKPIYLCVVKMKDNEGSLNTPYSAVSANKWAFAINNSACYYFVIALQKKNNTYQNTFYSVETFWGMTSKPKFDLYCYRNRTNNHPPLSELAVKHPILQEQKKLSRIQNSIEKLMAFKGSYKL